MRSLPPDGGGRQSPRGREEGTIMGMGVRNPFHPDALRLCDVRPYRSILVRTDEPGVDDYKAMVVGYPVTDDKGISRFPAVFLVRGRLRCYTVDAATVGVVPYAAGGWNHTWYVTAD